MKKLTLKDLETFIQWGIKIYPCKIEYINGSKSFYFPTNQERSRKWKWIAEAPQADPEKIYQGLSKGYELAGILPDNVCVLDCDDTDAFQYVYNLLEAFDLVPVAEKSLSYQETCQKHHFFFKTNEAMPYITKFEDLGFNGKGELLGAGHLIFFNKNSWYINPSEIRLPLFPEIKRSPALQKTDKTYQDIVIPDGERNSVLASFAGSLRRKGATKENIYQCLSVLNNQCEMPLSDNELQTISFSIGKYEPKDINSANEKIKIKMKGLL